MISTHFSIIWMLGSSSSQKGWAFIGRGSSGRWWSHHSWGCFRKLDVALSALVWLTWWCWSQVGLNLKGLFQTNLFYDCLFDVTPWEWVLSWSVCTGQIHCPSWENLTSRGRSQVAEGLLPHKGGSPGTTGLCARWGIHSSALIRLGPLLLPSVLRQCLLWDPIMTSNGLATLVHLHLPHQNKSNRSYYEAYMWKQIICK